MTPTLNRMRPFLLLTDIGFLLYWSVSVLVLAGVNLVPKEYLFNDYENPIVQAWNWSFFQWISCYRSADFWVFACTRPITGPDFHCSPSRLR